MVNIENYLKSIEIHIKKSKSNLTKFMYTPGGIQFVIMLPLVYLHKKHFNKVQEYVKTINQYSNEENLNIQLNNFCEIENSTVLYSKDQLVSLTAKQYELKLEYLNELSNNIKVLKKSLKLQI